MTRREAEERTEKKNTRRSRGRGARHRYHTISRRHHHRRRELSSIRKRRPAVIVNAIASTRQTIHAEVGAARISVKSHAKARVDFARNTNKVAETII